MSRPPNFVAGFAAVILGVLVCGWARQPNTPVAVTAPSTPNTNAEVVKKVGSRTPIPAGDAVIKGKIVFQGDPAPPRALIVGNQPCCVAPNNRLLVEQTWLIGKDKGVANVVVFLKAPSGHYFEPSAADKKQEGEVLLDQPHCAFIPHVVALYPVYGDADPKKVHSTGQVFKVRNGGVCLHNTKIAGDPLINTPFDKTLALKEIVAVELKPQPDPLGVACSVHPWMSAKVWVFDHPYFAVTGEDGTFEIKGLPTDAKISVVGWHEGAQYFHGGNKGTEYTLKKGETKDLGTIEIK